MSTLLTVPLTPELAMKLKMVKNKAEFARRAMEKYFEDLAVEAVLNSKQEAKDGKLLRGDIDKLADLI